MTRVASIAVVVTVAGISLAWVGSVRRVASSAFANASADRRSLGGGWSDPTSASSSMRNGHVRQFWTNGALRSDVTYLADAYDGEYRTWYERGAPYELRHCVGGHEEGVQQSWTDAGVLYLNYEVHDGRRFGLVNASPCNTVGEDGELFAPGQSTKGQMASGKAGVPSARRDGLLATRPDASGLPYYDEPTFSPRWDPVPHHVASFSLMTQSGHPYIAIFIYTQCAAICPLVVGQLSRVQGAVANGHARIVSFSVTPETDTPAALATFGRERNIDPRRWSQRSCTPRSCCSLTARAAFVASTTARNRMRSTS